MSRPPGGGGGGGIDGPGDGVDRPGVAFSESRDFSLNSEKKEARPSTYRERRGLDALIVFLVPDRLYQA